MMMHPCKHILVKMCLTFLFVLLSSPSVFMDLEAGQPNVCQRSIMVSKVERVSETERRVGYKMTWCAKIPFRCKKQIIRHVTVYKNQTRTVPQLVYECCAGYSRLADNCVAVCTQRCVHGHCMPHDTCLCHDGWQGSNCSNAICHQSCGKGECVAPDTCSCPIAWRGENCSIPVSGSARGLSTVLGAMSTPHLPKQMVVMLGGVGLLLFAILCLLLLFYYRRRYQHLKRCSQCKIGNVECQGSDSFENVEYQCCVAPPTGHNLPSQLPTPPIEMCNMSGKSCEKGPLLEESDDACETVEDCDNEKNHNCVPRRCRLAQENIYEAIPCEDSNYYEEIDDKVKPLPKHPIEGADDAEESEEPEDAEDEQYENYIKEEDDGIYDTPKSSETLEEEDADERIYENIIK